MPVARLLVLLSLLGAALPGVLQPAVAAVETRRPPAQVRLSALDPGVVQPGATLRVAGRVLNTGRQELRDVEVRLRLSFTRLGSRSELAAVAAGKTTSRDGGVVASRPMRDLGTGQAATFAIAAPVAELSSLTSFGVYVLGVEVLASRAEGFGRVALLRTFLPWVPPSEEVVPTRLTWLWPLVGRPSRLADGTFAGDALARAIAPGGRLDRLLAAGERLQEAGGSVTWALDPELVSAVADLADGYRLQSRDGEVSRGAGSERAVGWLARLRAVTAGRPVVALPYGDADVSALVRAGQDADVARALASGRTALAEAIPAADVLDQVTWPADGYASRGALAALRRTDISGVVLDGRAVPPVLDLRYTPSGRANIATRAGRLAGLLADPALADLLRDRGRDPVVAAQRVAAETAMIAAELPGGPQRWVLAMPPRRWNPGDVFLDRLVTLAGAATWTQPADLAEMLEGRPPEVERDRLHYPRSERRAELPESYVRALDDMQDSLAVFTAILSDPDQYAPTYQRSITLLSSTWWRTREAARANRLARERGSLVDLRREVRVQPGNFTFSSRSGTLALTVANGLPQEVTVALRLEPQTPRLRIGDIEAQTIGARSKQQVEVQATAVAAGPVVVDATLHTVGGAAYSTGPVQLRVTITEYGTVALYITVGAAAVLFLAAGIRVTRRVRGARATQTERPPPDVEAPVEEHLR